MKTIERPNGGSIRFYDPKEMKEYLDEYIVGQDDAKIALSVAVYNHYKRICINEREKTQYIKKSNVMMCGPTGCGKTYMISKIAEHMGVPYYIADATTLTQAGYVGDDVESILVGLLRNCDWNIWKAERGIVFLDECDKIAKRSVNTHITRDVVGEGVQQALLKMVEGSTVGVPPAEGRKHPDIQLTYIDTSNILFIASGAFSGIEDIVKDRLCVSRVGYGNDSDVDDNEDIRKDPYSYVSHEDLKSYGLIPEFIGRFPVIVSVPELSKDAMIKILGEAKGSVMRQYNYLFKEDGINLSVDYDAAELIAEIAIEMKTGARALRAITECVMNRYVYEKSGYYTGDFRITRKDVMDSVSKRYGKYIKSEI